MPSVHELDINGSDSVLFEDAINRTPSTTPSWAKCIHLNLSTLRNEKVKFTLTSNDNLP